MKDKNSKILAIRRPTRLVCIWLASGELMTTLVCRWLPADTNKASATAIVSTNEEAGGLRRCA